jgi:hypothetical protein
MQHQRADADAVTNKDSASNGNKTMHICKAVGTHLELVVSTFHAGIGIHFHSDKSVRERERDERDDIAACCCISLLIQVTDLTVLHSTRFSKTYLIKVSTDICHHHHQTLKL